MASWAATTALPASGSSATTSPSSTAVSPVRRPESSRYVASGTNLDTSLIHASAGRRTQKRAAITRHPPSRYDSVRPTCCSARVPSPSNVNYGDTSRFERDCRRHGARLVTHAVWAPASVVFRPVCSSRPDWPHVATGSHRDTTAEWFTPVWVVRSRSVSGFGAVGAARGVSETASTHKTSPEKEPVKPCRSVRTVGRS